MNRICHLLNGGRAIVDTAILFRQKDAGQEATGPLDIWVSYVCKTKFHMRFFVWII